ncbi:hypothetical protein LUZ62_076313 [Rhynchospora pubera]|uniref:Late embryogenesis abundant protein n=1 Tax=Rhynchospora pubera TaxID=906938 RepID=A0AAV8BCK5_9POAL|nr:hypothetical protein LUZ62_002945 [Rhynchospora pubera]KAJ4765938.1 hypothetical protein LUZ62_076313 [Rhynchospora pubera]
MIRNARFLLRFSISRSASKQPALPIPLKALSDHAHQPFGEIPRTHNCSRSSLNRVQLRFFSSNGGGPFEYSKEIDEINIKFAEAREEIETAMESKETVYFNEEAECARDAVKEALDLFQKLLDKLPDEEKGAVMRSMGLKMEQLKAELNQLDE